MSQLKSIKDLPLRTLKGKRVLLRLDLDVPVSNEGHVTEELRLERGLPSLQYLQSAGARVIVLGHIGKDGEQSLKPVAQWLEKHLPIGFVPSLELIEVFDTMYDGAAVMVENLRRYEGEQANDEGFAKQLAGLGDIYVNDAFAVCHREHASIVGLPKLLPSYAGLNLISEIEHLSKAFKPEHPFLFILGGAKFETKVPLIEKFLANADQIFIGGALANSFFKARGDDVGASLVDENLELVKPFLNNPKIILPVDTVIYEDRILDAGPQTVEQLKTLIQSAKFILWNGPLGLFEKDYRHVTNEVAQAIAAHSSAVSIVGGGDTIASIQSLNLFDKFTFVSTGGGAMLDFLATGTLPGVEALKEK